MIATPSLTIMHPGIWTWIRLPRPDRADTAGCTYLKVRLDQLLEQTATERIFPFNRLKQKRIAQRAPLYCTDHDKQIYALPRIAWPKLRQQLNTFAISYTEHASARFTPPELWFDPQSAIEALERSTNRKGQPIELLNIQKETCLKIASLNRSMQIEMPMGSGKSLILTYLVFALKARAANGENAPASADPYQALRPLVVAGKNIADSLQLHETLESVLRSNPQWQNASNHLCLDLAGHALRKKDKAVLKEGKGILVTTHRSLNKIPIRTKYILLDEEHAAATPAVLHHLIRRSQSCVRIYGTTATPNMRPDKADRLLETLIGPLLVRQNYRQYEAAGRVAPIHLHIYPFSGLNPYCHNPTKPESPPWGLNTYNAFVQNHRGRHQFLADLLLSLPADETKVMFIPTVTHANKVLLAAKIRIAQLCRAKQLSAQEAKTLLPVIIHAAGTSQDSAQRANQGNKTNQPQLLKELLQGKLKSAIVTDFMATGVDTTEIDHIIDGSGQAAKATNIQRSGRASRPREGKIAKLHVVKDEHEESLFHITNSKLSAYASYYGFLKEEDIPSDFLNEILHEELQSRIFLHPPNIPFFAPPEPFRLAEYIFIRSDTLLQPQRAPNKKALQT